MAYMPLWSSRKALLKLVSRCSVPRTIRKPSALQFAALLYLTVPLFLFFFYFTRPIISVPAVLIILLVVYRARPERMLGVDLSRREVLLCATISCLFLCACGYIPPLGRSWDWIKHFAIINELADHPWPPVNDEPHTFLRYYLGYYLVPALFSRAFGSEFIDAFVFVETWLGLFLILGLLLQKIRPRLPVAFLACFLLFSGLDLIGWMLFGKGSSLLVHKECWSGPDYAYEGNGTLFLWVPQHAIVGMLGILFLLPDGEELPPQETIGLFGVATALWSPFVTLGLRSPGEPRFSTGAIFSAP